MNIKRFSLARILIVFLAGLVLMINTACSQGPTGSNVSSSKMSDQQVADDNTSPNASSTRPYTPPGPAHEGSKSGTYPLTKMQSEHMKETYSTTEGAAGSMNNFKDTEPGVDKKQDKANFLVEQSKKNLERRASNPPQAVENLKETASANKVGDKVGQYGESLNNTVSGAAEGAKKGFENLKQNVKSAAEDVSDNIR